MKSPQNHVVHSAIAALALASVALTAACSNGTGSSLNPSGSSASSAAHHATPLDSATTRVGIKNNWTSTIAGSGSARCWTISPSLPDVGAGKLSNPVTLTYDLTCAFLSVLPITYGPPNGAAATQCTFEISYQGKFVYTVDNGSLTTCSVQPSSIAAYNEILIYNMIPPSVKHVR